MNDPVTYLEYVTTLKDGDAHTTVASIIFSPAIVCNNHHIKKHY